MSLKNDALTVSYPLFHYFSEQIRDGVIPWWFPNLHLGFPLHADPGFPFWSPITWICALVGSSLYIYTLLVWSYILIGGAGMIALTRKLGCSFYPQLLTALAYITCGYFVAHLQHPHYIFEAAFLPYALLYFLGVVQQPSLRQALCLAISLFFVVNSGYPSLPLATTVFFILLFAGILAIDPSARKGPHLKRVVYFMLAAAVITIGLCLPYLASLYDLLPRFNRSSTIAEAHVDRGGMTSRSFLSLLFPLATAGSRDFFGTDITWNNIYLGLLPTIFLVYGMIRSTHRQKWPLLIAGGIMLATSIQGSLKALFQRTIPFYELIHSNGGLRVFFILPALLIAAWGAEAFLHSSTDKLFRRISFFIATVFILALPLALVFYPAPSQALPGIVEKIKYLPPGYAIIFQSLLGMIVVLGLLASQRRVSALFYLGVAEITLAFLINLPYTGLGINPTTRTQQHIDSVKNNVRGLSGDSSLHIIGQLTLRDRIMGEPLFYASVVGKIGGSSYPSSLKSYRSFLIENDFTEVADEKVVSSTGKLQHRQSGFSLKEFEITGSRLSFEVSLARPDTLIIFQNHYPRWNYFMNGKAIATFPVLDTFTGLEAPAGDLRVSARYRPYPAIICWVISIFVWIAVLILLRKTRSGRRRR